MLRVVVLISLAYALAALIFLVVRTFAFGRTSAYAAPRGNVGRGLVYAFGQGMMPWAKESAAKHLPTFLAGILYHAGIFAAGLLLIALLAELGLSSIMLKVLRVALAAGLACGLGLFAKRLILPYMRFISCPDDYLSNLLVNILLAAALVASLLPAFQPLLFLSAIALSVYIPMGKIRHCFFFFYTRLLFGMFFGRRGVLPHRVAGE
jgi:hypothetical protein